MPESTTPTNEEVEAPDTEPENVDTEINDQDAESSNPHDDYDFSRQGVSQDQLFEDGAVVYPSDNIALLIPHTDAEILDGTAESVRVRYTGEGHTVIPLEFYVRRSDGDYTLEETDWIPTPFFEEDEDGDYYTNRVNWRSIFVDDRLPLTSRREALYELAENYREELQESTQEEVQSILDEIEFESDTEDYEQVAEATSEETEEVDSAEEVATVESQTTDTEDSVVSWSDLSNESVNRDMDGRYQFAETEEEKLREMAADIETRVDHLLRKRQRIVRKLERLQNE